MWYKDNILESYRLEEGNKVICAIHPKPTKEYVKHVGISVFGDEEKFNEWYNNNDNFWLAYEAPSEMTTIKVLELLCNISEGSAI